MPFGSGFVIARGLWYRQWFTDDTPTLALLREFAGEVFLHLGEIDRQLSVVNETELVSRWSGKMAQSPKVVVHDSRGHAFATGKPVSGPMDKEAEDKLVADLVAMLQPQTL